MSNRSISSLLSIVVLAGLSACSDSTGCKCVSATSEDHYGSEPDVRANPDMRDNSSGVIINEPQPASPGVDRRYYNIPSNRDGLPVYRNN